MTIALIDNGSLEPAAHRNLRAVAAELSRRAGAPVAAVSWRHSDRLPSAALDDLPAWTLARWVRARAAEGDRTFLFVPFFISAQGAIGTALRADAESLAIEIPGISFEFTGGFGAPGEDPAPALALIVAARVREAMEGHGLLRPAVLLVDHGGPARSSAALRDRVTEAVRAHLGSAAGSLSAASMESPDGPDFAFNQPLFADLLRSPGFDRGDVVVAPLFLSPGRHAGPGGDLEHIVREAEARSPGLRCRFTGLVGSHPLAAEFLAKNLFQHVS